MNRRTFLRNTGLATGSLLLPVWGRTVSAFGETAPLPAADKKALADAALNAATKKGATYVDVRIGRYLNQFVITREDKVENIANTESYGAGVRVLADGAWGFFATDQPHARVHRQGGGRSRRHRQGRRQIADDAGGTRPAEGSGRGELAARPSNGTPSRCRSRRRPTCCWPSTRRRRKTARTSCNSNLFTVNEQKYFASTDGSYIDQDVHRIWPAFGVTAIDPKTGKFQVRRGFGAPCGRGYEYLDAKPEGKLPGVATRYTTSYDMIQDATDAAKQVREKLAAKSVEAGQYDLVLDPSHLWLTIHESVGHATELDRVLGYEANFAGTSFATLDKWESKNFKYGSPQVHIVADKTQPGSLGAVGYDDEGVPCGKWDLIKDGILVNYQKTRDQAHIIGQKYSDGCSYADSWNDVQFQRMPNVSLQPGSDPKLTTAEMIKGVERGIYIVGDGSFSIDQQRYNFQFGGQLFYEIKNGEIVGMLRDVAYQSNTQEFWNSCVAVCGENDYALGGSFFDGKGQPEQISAVSHGSSTARFNKVKVLNTARKI